MQLGEQSSYSSDGSHVVRVMLCAPNVPHTTKENRSTTRPGGLRLAEMRQRKYFVDRGLRQSTVLHTSRHTDSSQQDQTEVLVEPLQQRSFWLLLSWRWCALDSERTGGHS